MTSLRSVLKFERVTDSGASTIVIASFLSNPKNELAIKRFNPLRLLIKIKSSIWYLYDGGFCKFRFLILWWVYWEICRIAVSLDGDKSNVIKSKEFGNFLFVVVGTIFYGCQATFWLWCVDLEGYHDVGFCVWFDY